MSFKEWSSAHSAPAKPAKEKPGDKCKTVPAADQPPAQSEKTPTEVAPGRKS